LVLAVLAASVLPLLAPRDPDAQPDTMALRVLPPCAVAYRVSRVGEPDVWASRIEEREGALVLRRGPRTLEVPASSVEGKVERVRFLLGTDQLGRDLLSRCLAGARASLLVAGAAVALAVLLGAAIGASAGGSSGRIDALLMRGTDVFLSLPRLFLILLLASLFPRSLLFLVLAPWPTP